jgi:hypothetical protein
MQYPGDYREKVVRLIGGQAFRNTLLLVALDGHFFNYRYPNNPELRIEIRKSRLFEYQDKSVNPDYP